MIHTINIILLIILFLFVLFQFSIYYKANKLKGTPVNKILDEFKLSSESGQLLLFFHNKNCGPCRLMMPDIIKLRKQSSDIISIDVAEYRELAQKLNIRATPTTLLIKEGRVEKVLLGRQSEQTLHSLLEIP